jgi:ankyrin repeat protein
MVAAECGNIELVHFLVAAGASTTAADADGLTALQLALVRGHQQVAHALISETDAQADV